MIFDKDIIIFIFPLKIFYKMIMKILVVGDSNVGKTAIIYRYTQKKLKDTLSTPENDDTKGTIIQIEGQQVNLQFIDTAGLERFRNITKAYYRSCNGVMIIFDLTCRDSFTSLNYWVDSLKDGREQKKYEVILVGNKCESNDREVTTEEAEKFALENDLHYFEVSANTNDELDDAIYYLATQCYHLFANK